MISTCHSAGVKVIAGMLNDLPLATPAHLCCLDTIFNHMTASQSGTGVAGSSFTQFNYPGIYQDDVSHLFRVFSSALKGNQNFHHCGLEPNDVIVNYDNALEVQTCELDVRLFFSSLDSSHFPSRAWQSKPFLFCRPSLIPKQSGHKLFLCPRRPCCICERLTISRS